MFSILKKLTLCKSDGFAVLTALIFIAVFSALAVSMAALSTTNAQVSSQQHQVNNALTSRPIGT